MIVDIYKEDQVRETLETFTEDGQVFEIMAKGVSSKKHRYPHAARGYFVSVAAAMIALKTIWRSEASDKDLAVYFTPSPLHKDVLSIANNRFKKLGAGDTRARDSDVLRRKVLMVDLDPKRRAGIPSSEEELENSRFTALSISQFLKREAGFPGGAFGMSGNGYHLIYSIDLPNDDEASLLLENVLKVLGEKFSDDDVEVDLQTSNPSRSLRLYGALSCKGESTAERPHRFSFLDPRKEGEDGDLSLVSREQLEKIAGRLKTEKPSPSSTRTKGNEESNIEEYPIEEFVLPNLGKHGKRQDKSYGRIYVLENCPFSDKKSHKNKAIVGQKHSGEIFAKCQKSSCASKRWSDISDFATSPPRFSQTSGASTAPKIIEPPMEKPMKMSIEINEGKIISLSERFKGVKLSHSPKMKPKKRRLLDLLCCEKKQPSEGQLYKRWIDTLDIDGIPAVADQGFVWRYRQDLGIYEKQTQSDAVRSILKWDGELLDNLQLLDISAKKCKSVYWLGLSQREEEGFFQDSAHGFVAGSTFIRADKSERVIKFEEHSHLNRVRSAVGVEYDPDARGELLDHYLKTVHHSDPPEEQKKKIQLMGEFLFATLCGLGPWLGKALFCVDGGDGGGGKSQFLHILSAMVPKSSQASVQPRLFNNEYYLARLAGMTLNVIFEMDSAEILKESGLKSLISGEMISARWPRGEPFEFPSRILFAGAGNGLAPAPNATNAFWERWLVMEFSSNFRSLDSSVKEIKDIGLEIVKKEKAAVIRWAVESGERLMREKKYTMPESSIIAMGRWRSSGDSVASWVRDRCELLPVDSKKSKWMTIKDAHQSYVEMCEEWRLKPAARPKFLDRLERDGITQGKSGARRLNLKRKIQDELEDEDDDLDSPF